MAVQLAGCHPMTCKSLSGEDALDLILRLRDKILWKQAICILSRLDRDREVLRLHVGRLMMTCTLQCSTQHVSLAWSVKAGSYYQPCGVPLPMILDGISPSWAGRCWTVLEQCPPVRPPLSSPPSAHWLLSISHIHLL